MGGISFSFAWEVAFMEWLQTSFGKAGTGVGTLFTYFGEELVLVALLGFLYWCYDKKFGKFVGVNLVAVLVWNPMIKNVFMRRRPYFDHPEIKCLRASNSGADPYSIAAQDFSFPSGHSANAAAAYGSLAVYKKKRIFRIAAVCLPLLVGLSRNLLGVHYPTDVMAGWLVGAAGLAIVSWLRKYCRTEKIFYGVLALSGLPGLFYCTSDDYFTTYGLLLGALAAFLFEERYVNFENTTSWIRSVLRVLGGVLLFFGLSEVLKLPFSKEFLENGTFISHMVRLVRYWVLIFIDLGIYPMLFKYTKEIGKTGVK